MNYPIAGVTHVFEDETTLLDRISDDPDAIAELTREELEQAKADLLEFGQSVMAGLDESEDKKADIKAAKEARERLSAVKERLAEFEAEDEAIAEEAAEISVAFEAEEEPEPEEPEAVEEPEAEEEPEPVEEPEAVAASKGQMKARVPKKFRQPEEPKALVASAGPGVKGRDRFENGNQIAEAALKLWKSFGSHAPRSQERHLVAQFDTSSQHKYQTNGDLLHDAPIVSQMIKEAQNLDALTAAGLCGPATPVYDYFSISEEAGMISLPSATSSRGQITYPVSPGFPDIRDTAAWSAAAGQEYTNTEAGDEGSKNTYSVQCPSTNTCTVDAYPVILQYGNFQQRFNPELVAHTLAESMRFHAHFVNSNLITDMVAASTAQGGGDTGGGGLVNVANLVGFEAAKYRDNFRMSPSAILDLVLPAWVLNALVADLVSRNATTSFENAEARVRSLFASLGVRTQFVQDWQSIADNADGGWPTAADLILFAPGTFVRLDNGTLDLGIVRDSTLNATNEFQIFVETFEYICEVGHDSWLLDDITICPRGGAGADVTLDCNPGFGS